MDYSDSQPTVCHNLGTFDVRVSVSVVSTKALLPKVYIQLLLAPFGRDVISPDLVLERTVRLVAHLLRGSEWTAAIIRTLGGDMFCTDFCH
jgi:hypothetical protein